MEIKRMLFMSQPLPQEYDDGTPALPEYDAQKLEFVYQFMYDNDPNCQYKFDRSIKENSKQDINELMAGIIDDNIQYERTRDTLLGAHFRWVKYLQHHPQIGQAITKAGNSDKPQLYLLTFTLGTDENQNETNLKNYVLSHLKNYKFMYTEEHGGKNNRYHIHVIVHDAVGDGFYRTKNLRPTKKYNGYIDIKKYTKNNDNEGKYLSKENGAKGDVQIIQDLIRKL